MTPPAWLLVAEPAIQRDPLDVVDDIGETVAGPVTSLQTMFNTPEGKPSSVTVPFKVSVVVGKVSW